MWIHKTLVNANWVFNFLKHSDHENYGEGACVIQLLVNTASVLSTDRSIFQH